MFVLRMFLPRLPTSSKRDYVPDKSDASASARITSPSNPSSDKAHCHRQTSPNNNRRQIRFPRIPSCRFEFGFTDYTLPP